MKTIFTTTLLCLAMIIKGQVTYQVDTIVLGLKNVYLYQYQNNYKPTMPVFIHVHENETASLKAGLDYITEHGGKVISLKHSEDGKVNRLITFKYKKKEYNFDPNRIFSNDKNVLKKTLVSADSTKMEYRDALTLVDQLAHKIWSYVEEAPSIIALHNNKNECATCVRKGWFGRKLIDESYNITSYVQKCDVKNDSNLSCTAIYINPVINNSEFFIVTSPADFEDLSQKKYNVVLQNPSPVDDGSMSVFAHKNKKRYINVEAKQGRNTEQLNMINLLLTDHKK